MCIFAWTCSHAGMDMQRCRHGHAEIRACRHAGMDMHRAKIRASTCRHANMDMHAWTAMETWTCKHGHANLQTRWCKHAGHADVDMQAWLATWRWEWQELAKRYKKWLRQVHLDMQTRSRMHSDMAMQTWTSCRDAAMEKWTWRDGYESIHTWTCKRAAKQTWTCRNETLICRHAHRTMWLGTWRWEWPELASMSAYALVHACIYMSAFLLVCTPVCLHRMSAVLQIHAWKSLPYSRVMLR